MLLAKKLLLEKFNPLMFLCPASGAFTDFYATRDGINLSVATLPVSTNANQLTQEPVYGNRRYMIVIDQDGSSPSTVCTSPDGITWSHVADIPSQYSPFAQGLVFDGDYFYLATYTMNGAYCSGVQFFRSEDGTVWTQVSSINAPSVWFYNYVYFAYGNGTFVIMGAGASLQDQIVLYSTDNCATWAASSFTYPATYTSQHTAWLGWTDGYFIAGIYTNGRTSASIGSTPFHEVYSSTDGSNWTHGRQFNRTSAVGKMVFNAKTAFLAVSGNTPDGNGYLTGDGLTYTGIDIGTASGAYASSAINNKYACASSYDQTNQILTLRRYSLIDGTNRATQISLSSAYKFIGGSL